jgi:hypothetical protein
MAEIRKSLFDMDLFPSSGVPRKEKSAQIERNEMEPKGRLWVNEGALNLTMSVREQDYARPPALFCRR